jgi:hypothetical protein
MLLQLLLSALLLSASVSSQDEDEVTVETIKQEDDIAYITPDHHPDVFFSDHFDHPVSNIFNSLLLG